MYNIKYTQRSSSHYIIYGSDCIPYHPPDTPRGLNSKSSILFLLFLPRQDPPFCFYLKLKVTMFLSLSILKEIVYDTNLFQALINFLVNKKYQKATFFFLIFFTQIFIFFPKNYTFPLRRNKFFSSRKVMIFQKKKYGYNSQISVCWSWYEKNWLFK